jgi:short subunit dehydrogenase-like uncharacterized protein
LRPILAGRNQEKLRSLAEPLGLEFRVASLEDRYALDTAVRDVDVVLNIAGPFSKSASSASSASIIAEACLRNGVHYLDVAGELEVFEELHCHHARALATNVMLMPGVGFVIVPSDCLAAYAAAKLPGTTHLRIGLSRADRAHQQRRVDPSRRSTPHGSS